ncbi:MAG: hypothetical protein HQ548_07020 [Chloroflexi bacterium]|nr:hypothetical protein [Chloroflexota bacterium]
MPTWLWLLQRLSGLLILGLVFAHMVVNHFADPATTISVGYVVANLRKATLLSVDSALLLLGLFHGLTGLRNVLYDFFAGARSRRLIAWGCAATGAIFFVFGVVVLIVVLGR